MIEFVDKPPTHRFSSSSCEQKLADHDTNNSDVSSHSNGSPHNFVSPRSNADLDITQEGCGEGGVKDEGEGEGGVDEEGVGDEDLLSARSIEGRAKSVGQFPVWKPSMEYQRFVRKYGDSVGGGSLGEKLLGSAPPPPKPRKRRDASKDLLLQDVRLTCIYKSIRFSIKLLHPRFLAAHFAG